MPDSTNYPLVAKTDARSSNDKPRRTEEFIEEISAEIIGFLFQQKTFLRSASDTSDEPVEFAPVLHQIRTELDERINCDVDETVIEAFDDAFNWNRSLDSGGEDREARLRRYADALNRLQNEETKLIYRFVMMKNLGHPWVMRQSAMSGYLINLVADVEVTVRHMMESAAKLQGGIQLTGNDTIAIEDIGDEETGAEIRRRVTQEKIDSAIYGSPKDWVRFFQNQFGINAENVGGLEEVLEPIQRRHCHVHNRGRVSSRYLSRVPDASVEIGQYLHVNHEYLERAADHFAIFVYSLTWLVLEKLTRNDSEGWEKAKGVLTFYIFDLLNSGRYSVLMLLDGLVPRDRVEASFRLVLDTNIWLAYKFSGNFDKVRSTVTEWDVSDLGIRFQLSKAALLDQIDEAVQLVKVGLEIGDLTPSDVVSWPLLKDVYPVFASTYDLSDFSEDDGPARSQ